MEGHPDRQDQVLKPEDLTETFELAAGQAVVLRSLRREDHGIEHAFVSGLSPETRHNRLRGFTLGRDPEDATVTRVTLALD